jgi:UDP-glucose 4-epimerase
MSKTDCKKLIFSSSAAVYSPLAKSPYTEQDTLRFTNPYAHTKIICEQILEGLCESDPKWRVGILRYFNPAGAHSSGLLGEDPGQYPANLFPNILNAASGQSEAVKIYGGDYPTPDGTGIRDFIHVMDLAEAHFASIQALAAHKFHLVNVGSGEGSSVLEVIRKFEEVTGKKIAHRLYPRRDGDLPIAYADVAKAEKILGWKASRGVDEMCKSAWKWKTLNPTGY